MTLLRKQYPAESAAVLFRKRDEVVGCDAYAPLAIDIYIKHSVLAREAWLYKFFKAGGRCRVVASPRRRREKHRT